MAMGDGELRSQRGEVPVRLLAASGQPLRNLTVSALLPDLMALNMMRQDRSTTSDANGCCRLQLMRGRATVVVRRSFEERAGREVDVVPGANAELLVQVPR